MKKHVSELLNPSHKIYILYGLTPSAGRQYGTMFFQNEPLTLDEMTEELGMSKTSMSTSVRALSDLKLVERAWKRGVRKDLYQVKDDWYQSFIDIFSIKWRRSVSLPFSRSQEIIGRTGSS